MKFTGYKRVRITSIKLDAADIRKRSKEPHVGDLAQSIRENGEELIHAPTVRMPGKTLLCGRDRMAALIALKHKSAWVRLVECDDDEAKRLEVVENLYRRPENRPDLIAQLVALKEQQLRAEIELTHGSGAEVTSAGERRVTGAASDPETRAGQRAIKAAARKGAARDAGVTQRAVRYDEKTSAIPENTGTLSGAPAAEAEEPAPFPDNLQVLGIEDASTEAVCKFARPVQEAIDEADKHLRLALGALKRIEGTPVGQTLRAQVERVGSLVRSERPEAICPWCKGLPKATIGHCAACAGVGYVSAEKCERAMPELLKGPPVAMVDGKAWPYEDVRDGKAPPKNGTTAKATKHIRVENENGDDITPDADEAY